MSTASSVTLKSRPFCAVKSSEFRRKKTPFMKCFVVVCRMTNFCETVEFEPKFQMLLHLLESHSFFPAAQFLFLAHKTGKL